MVQNRKLASIQNKPYVTYAIIIITVIVYIMMTLSGGSQNTEVLIQYGAKFNFAIIYFNQWWRLITPMFLHIGLAHILFNLLIVYYLGSNLEYFFGHFKYALLYLLGGIMGNIFSFAFNISISAGASTAIFGLFMSTIALSRIYPNRIQIQNIASQYGLLIGLNIFIGILSTGIDNMGHLGGLVGGYLATYMITKTHNPGSQLKYTLIYIAIALLGIFWGYNEIFYINF
ncbi:Rhomboid protease gluP [Alloiococcus otitis]|uniref:Peptidase S54 rhomboid domain-containing protein n=1 Tax=Alloiococcus otitis ATCC 51267 TaxID=883081 RepID=K9EBK0_9LACT|nr:rhomboid family intramembrane serine protease [Alloiococcus otitis]EKU94048.1 hypothetical protein HMPREF9698_00360 [Alloiococcus otitis ATCC 51267]SUU81038.1 Rhomboid protease gluP [Alloiococcus otitis]